MSICKHCQLEIDTTNKPKGFMGNHTRWCDKNPKKEEYIKYLKNNGWKNFNSDKNNHIKLGLKVKQAWLDGKYDNVDFGKSFRGKHHSTETKQIISSKRSLFLKENPDKHPWKNKNKHVSVPCENVKKILNDNNIKFIEEYSPLKNKNYSIDIAFPDIKLGLEINGNQHYDIFGNLTEYYQIRHDEIVAAGWVLLEIHYTLAFNENEILKLLDIKEQPDYSEYFSTKELNKIKKENLLNTKNEKRLKLELDKKEKTDKLIFIIKNSLINFNKFGWVKEVSELTGIRIQKVNAWMKLNMNDFYNEKCFKRKSIKT